MTIEALMKVAPPPTTPTDAYPGPWEATERAMQTKLPQDYKDFIRVYGSGQFLDFFGFHNPFSEHDYVNLYKYAWIYDWYEKKARAEDPEEVQPYDFWPTPGGLIPMGRSEDSEVIFWLPEGPPEAWKVVVWDRCDDPGAEVFDCDMTTFIAGVVSGEIRPKGFPDELLPCDTPFVPDKPYQPEPGDD